MAAPLHTIESRITGWLRLSPPRSRLGRAVFWLLLLYAALMLGRLLPFGRGFFAAASGWVLFALIVTSLPLLARWIYNRLLWKVRNRLIVTYLLMGLAPIVLFAVLAFSTAWVFSGQFAIFAATSEIESELSHLESQNAVFAAHVGHELELNPRARIVDLPEFAERDHGSGGADLEVDAFYDGAPLALKEPRPQPPAIGRVPAWAGDGFRGVVYDEGKLYLRAIDSHTFGGHAATVVTSIPLGVANVEQLARGLGRVVLVPSFAFEEEPEGGGLRPSINPNPGSQIAQEAAASVESGGRAVRIDGRELVDDEHWPNSVAGGKLTRQEHFYDFPVAFFAPLKTTDWQSGKPRLVRMDVASRPSLLYQRLFITSLVMARFWRIAFIILAIFFAVLELIAFIMAIRLNRTITQSVHDLYDATHQIDRGNLAHRIVVKRRDQLAALSSSFNRMTASLERLLEEQREKERLQNELEIAQEVQATLFPRDDFSLPALEIHGVCRPARTVSGDYYDFLHSGESSIGLALGDISGKGISAALLMASLHSAVRAYCFAGEELLMERAMDSRIPVAGRGPAVAEVDCGVWFESPGKILALLNRHLYRSTQPEKYATLFLAHYESRSQQLTYSNGGQLPPLILRADDTVTRLDRGGTVVGLIDGMDYEEGSVRLNSGDILVAFSDGVTEPENEFGEFGEARLLEIVRRNRHLPLPVICEQALHALRDWIGSQEQPDDITLVLARQR